MKQTIDKIGVGSMEEKSQNKLKYSSLDQGSSDFTSDSNKVLIKEEPVFVAESSSVNRSNDFVFDSDPEQFEGCEYDDVFYGNTQMQRRFNRYNNGQYRNYGNSNKKIFVKRNQLQLPKKNPCDSYGKVMGCDFCRSEYHLIANCPVCPKQLKEEILSKRVNRSSGSQSHFV